MADIIHLNGDPHREVQELLPWYVEGALDAEEAALVAAHLETCTECQAELRTDRALSAMMATASPDIELGWAELSNRIGRAPRRRAVGRRGTAGPRRAPIASRTVVSPRSRGWAVAAQAASLALVGGLAWVWGANQPRAQYHTLSSPGAVSHGNIVVVFQPTTTEQDMRGAFRSADARVVDGPTTTDAYVLQVAGSRRAAILARLHANAQVVLAEPID